MNSVHITLNYSWDAIEASNACSSAVIAPSFLDFSKVIAKIVQRISTAPTRSVNKGCWLNITTWNHSLSIKTPDIAGFRINQWCTWTPNAIRICSDLIIFITHWNVLFDEYFCCPEKSRSNTSIKQSALPFVSVFWISCRRSIHQLPDRALRRCWRTDLKARCLFHAASPK